VVTREKELGRDSQTDAAEGRQADVFIVPSELQATSHAQRWKSKLGALTCIRFK
jgi:hypothetical protein